MGKNFFYFIILTLVLLPCLVTTANAADTDLVGWWKLDDGAGLTAIDSSGNGNDGKITGTPTWIAAGKYDGALQFNGTDCFINCGNGTSLNQFTNQITMSFWIKTAGFTTTFATVISKGDGAWRMGRNAGGNVMHMGYTGGNYFDGSKVVTDNEWHFCAGVYNGSIATIYVDGAADTTNSASVQIPNGGTYNVLIGANEQQAGRFLAASLDDVRLYKRALTLDELLVVMEGPSDEVIATKPQPKDKETDVYIQQIMSWKSGELANTHNVFFGTDFNDVNNATLDSHSNVTVAQGLVKDNTNYNPGTLEFGTTYYWRVDEVNAPPDSGINKGTVWSFRAEDYALKIPASDIVATAKNSAVKNDPNNVINELGLDPNTGQHSTSTGNWQSSTANSASDPLWIRFDFRRSYKLHQMFVWNMNNKPVAKYGFQKVRVEYLKDNDEWATLTAETTFAIGSGTSDYVYNTTVEFNDVVAKAVRLTMISNWDNKVDKGYLSEIRFTCIPTYARLPLPDTDVNNISVDSVLSWRKGREASSHSVYIDTNENAVANGTAAAHSASTNSYTPSLNLGRVYYWRVDEINSSMTPSKWSGDVWSFSTEEYITMDDFEDYNDFIGSLIFETWVGGDSDSTLGGSQVGHTDAPFAEEKIFQSGKQSGPIYYNNTAVGTNTSIGERSFEDTLNLTSNGADTLRLFYRGKAVTFNAAKDGSIAMSAEGSDIQGTADQFRFAYKTLTSSTGSITVRVDSIENANAWSKAGIMIRNSLEPNDVHVTAVLAANNTAEMESRSTKGGGTTVADVTNLGNPCWLKISRNGNDFTVQRSKDGTNWYSFGTDPNVPSKVTITMGSTVYIGLVVTSHTADVLAAATFYNASTTGSVSGSTWTVAPIGDIEQAEGGNTLDALYVYLTDSTGKVSAKVYAPLLSAVGSGSWMKWEIPTSYFTNVNLTKIKKISIGVGDTATPLKGKGLIYIDNIGYGHTLVK
jgi:regulation of enolase protein 1 (concanavalin A-like superfamily)